MNIWDKFKSVWTNLLWLVAGIVVLIDPRHVYEWAHQHEGWSGLIVALWAALLAWAGKHRPQDQAVVFPPGTPQSPIVPQAQGPVTPQGSKQWKQP